MKKIIFFLLLCFQSYSQYLVSTTSKGQKLVNVELSSTNLFSPTNQPISGIVYYTRDANGITVNYPVTQFFATNEMKVWNGQSFMSIVSTLPISTDWNITGNVSSGNPLATNLKLGSLDNADVKIITNNTDKIIVKANGNVGIATNSPTEKIDIVGSIKFSGELKPNNISGTLGQILTASGVGLAPTWTTPAAITANNGLTRVVNNIELGGSPLVKNTNIPLSTFNLTTSGSGKVGIGITTPESDLCVNATQTAAGSPQFEISTPSAGGGTAYGGLNANQLNSGGLFFHTANVAGVGQVGSIIAGGNTGGGFSSKLNFLTTATGGTQPLVRLHISNTGNIGIGNINPLAKLDITGNIKIQDGTQGAGKVLTSDATGLATWQTPVASVVKVALICRNKTAQTINGWTLLTNWTEIQDPTNSFTPTTGVFTAPRSGVYTFTIGDGLQPGASSYGGLSIRKNGTQLYNMLLNNVTGIMYAATSGTVELAAGDTISPFAYSTAVAADIATASNTWFTIVEQ